MRYIRREFAGAPRVRDVARAAGWSPLHLQRRFTERYGRTVKQVVDELRIAAARRMLLRGVRHGEISRRLNFATPSHFTYRFRQLMGMSPSRWLRQQRSRKAIPRARG
jgi:AraC-like DNA-binding protein